jgi:hypothetical protein
MNGWRCAARHVDAIASARTVGGGGNRAQLTARRLSAVRRTRRVGRCLPSGSGILAGHSSVAGGGDNAWEMKWKGRANPEGARHCELLLSRCRGMVHPPRNGAPGGLAAWRRRSRRWWRSRRLNRELLLSHLWGLCPPSPVSFPPSPYPLPPRLAAIRAANNRPPLLAGVPIRRGTWAARPERPPEVRLRTWPVRPEHPRRRRLRELLAVCQDSR